MEQKSIYKIYSRKRLNFIGSNSPKKRKFKKKIKNVLPILLIIIISFSTCLIFWNAIDPIYEKVCKEQAKSIATHIANENSSLVIKKYNYNDFFNIEKDKNENIKMISANILSINQVSSEIAINIQKQLDQASKEKVKIPIGSLTGIKMISGFGPNIDIKIATVGSVDTDLKSEFISQNINQTLHRVYLNIECNVNILTPFSTIEDRICNQVLLAENVIIGEIPATYYNLEGLDSKNDILETIE